MSFHLYMAFVIASAIVICTPGPTVLMVIADAMAHHQRHAWSTVLGVGAGDLVAMTISLAGAGALLRASVNAFLVLKTAGGLYLLYLGLRSIQATRNRATSVYELGEASATRNAASRFGSAFTVTVTNPKLILFFVAFVPQFISAAGSFVYQGALLILTFDLMAMVNATGYAYAARTVGAKLSSPENQRRVGWVSGAILLLAGVLVLALRFHAK
jgi:threonine/homoserine/homoserine lactone efflux protein